MPFEFSATSPVNTADRAPAETAPLELGTPSDGSTPEKGADNAETLDDAIDDAQDSLDEGGDDLGGDDGDGEAEPRVGDNLPDGRSAYVKREEYGKREAEIAQLRAELEAERSGGWNTLAPILTREGFESAEAFRQAIQAQNEQLAEKREREAVEARVNELIDKDYAPELHKRMTDLEMAQERVMRRDRESTLKELPVKYPHADMATVKHFGTTPEVAEAIAKHTHSVMAAREERHAKEIEIAKKQAVLDYVAGKNKAVNPPPESGGPRSVPSKAKQEGYTPGRFGFPARKTRV